MSDAETASVDKPVEKIQKTKQEDGKKLSKKQQKALEFREKKKSGESTKDIKEERKAKKRDREDEEGSKKNKKQKKASSKASPQTTEDNAKEGGSGKKKFILFIGNLPYNVSTEDIQQHFKAAQPLTIRPRKGFAFAEFEGGDAARRLNVALRLHHTTFQQRKINVELTAGGGGNSANRRQKLRDRNDKLNREQNERIGKEKEQEEKKKSEMPPAQAENGLHPDRLKQLHR